MKNEILTEAALNLNDPKLTITRSDIEWLLGCKKRYEEEYLKLSAEEQVKNKNKYFLITPWGISYNVCPRGKKASVETAVKYLFIALIIQWAELVDQLKRTVISTYKVSKADLIKARDVVITKHVNTIAKDVSELQMKTESLHEDIEKHDELNPKLFEGEKLKEDIREKIFELAKFFTDSLAEDEIKINVKDIILVGSNASYNYTKDSDLDIHLIADLSATSCPDNLYPKLYSAYRSIFNKNMDIDFYGIPVELYVETEEVPLVSNGIYSVMKDEWIKKPVQQDIPEIDHEAFDKEFKIWENKYNELIKDINS